MSEEKLEYSKKSAFGRMPDEHTVLVSTAHYVPAFRGGGPIQTLKALIKAAPPEFTTRVVCANHDLGDTAPLVNNPNQWTEVDSATVRYVQGGIRSLVAAFISAQDARIIYLNSFFNPRYSTLPLLLKCLGFWKGATILIAPRGELAPGALALKSRKKAPFITTFRLFRLHKMVLWHASTKEEADQIQTVFKGAKVLIRENETYLPSRSIKRKPRGEGPACLLFASRLHEKKGLHILLEALAKITYPVNLEIIGAFEDSNYESTCKKLASDLQDNVKIIFKGALSRDKVLQRMHGSDLMVFPTAGENFGHVIAEALSTSCPVMCSTHTPWNEHLNRGGGVLVDPNTPEAWARALNGYLNQGPDAWETAATRAGTTFNSWQNEDKGTHIFKLVAAERARKNSSTGSSHSGVGGGF